MAIPAFKIMSLFLSVFVGFASVGLVSSAKFDELFQPTWAFDHFTHEGELLHMKLDNFSGTYTIFFRKSIATSNGFFRVFEAEHQALFFTQKKLCYFGSLCKTKIVVFLNNACSSCCLD